MSFLVLKNVCVLKTIVVKYFCTAAEHRIHWGGFFRTSAPSVQIAILKRSSAKEGGIDMVIDTNIACGYKFALCCFILSHETKLNDSLFCVFKQLSSIFPNNDLFLLKTYFVVNTSNVLKTDMNMGKAYALQ